METDVFVLDYARNSLLYNYRSFMNQRIAFKITIIIISVYLN